jgi:UDP-N-acetylmuramyl tripeptide synthase
LSDGTADQVAGGQTGNAQAFDGGDEGLIVLDDSRRLTGPNLLLDRAGAMLDVQLPAACPDRAVELWTAAAHRALAAVGWGAEVTAVRRFPGGASFAISAPIDALYAATEVNEWALDAANASLAGLAEPSLDEAAPRLRELIAAESNPPLIALRDEARRRGVTFLFGEGLVSVGSGTGAVCWPAEKIPLPDTVPWSDVHDVPTVLVTGSNGKTTTVRLLGAVASAAGLVPGVTCTDSVSIGGELLAAGDWTGPGGARMVLRDRRVQVAILETARGGILRRGLAVERADAAIITNVAADHFGEFGIYDLAGLAEAKLVVGRALGRAVGADAPLILNADDPVLVQAARPVDQRVTWFSLDHGNPMVIETISAAGIAVVVEHGEIVLFENGRREPVVALADVPVTHGGAARHNVSNVLGVVALARSVGIGIQVIARGLAGFRGTAGENPGRLNSFELGGVRVLVDFAHNPHGMRALVELAATLPAHRRLIILGQAGDRDDEAIRELARSAWPLRPDRIILKEMEAHLRGRQPGEATGVLADEFRRLGVPEGTISGAESELQAVREALDWARAGDLLLLPLHSQRDEVLTLLEGLGSTGWVPGTSGPE